jgi:hypothetical protein
MAGTKDLAFSPGLALPVGSLVVLTTSADYGLAPLGPTGVFLVSLTPAGAVLGFLGLAGVVLLVVGPPVVVLSALGPHHLLPAPKFQSADQEQMLKELATQGLPSLLWSATGPAAR